MGRQNTGIDVVVFQPFSAETNEHGWVRASYRLAILSVNSGTYLLDEFGVGVGRLEDMVFYQQPVYSIEKSTALIGMMAPIVGCYPISRDMLSSLVHDSSMDLAQFIRSGDDCNLRLEQWVKFWRDQRAKATDE